MKLKLTALLFLMFTILSASFLDSAAVAKSTKVTDPKALDYHNANDRYAWYQAVRQYLIKKGDLNCPPGYALEIFKDGKFKTHSLPTDNLSAEDAKKVKAANQACAVSVSDKKFPLPANAPIESVLFPIRDHKAKAWTRAELDKHIFRITAAP